MTQFHLELARTSRWPRFVVSAAVFAIAIALFWDLNTTTQTIVADKIYRAWGWPIGIWGSGIPGDFGDPIEIGVMLLNGLICISLSSICAAVCFVCGILLADRSSLSGPAPRPFAKTSVDR